MTYPPASKYLRSGSGLIIRGLATAFVLVLVLLTQSRVKAQVNLSDDSTRQIPTNSSSALDLFLTPSDTFNRGRFWKTAAVGGALYTAASVGLWQAWYRDYELGKFHLIDDRGEWEHMDKMGHGYTAYHYARWSNQGLLWSGTPRTTRLILATGTSLLLQSTIELMDGYSSAWGFSWSDMAFNTGGASLFLAQELVFREQRIRPKFSAFRQNHSTAYVASSPSDAAPESFADRAAELYGTTPWQRFVKDYNGQTVWLSTNPAVLAGFGESTKFNWLMLSVGYSARNVYGAFGNVWGSGGAVYNIENRVPREREYILSLDIDFERIPARKPVVKTLLMLLNHMKFPAPALVLNAQRQPDWRWFYY